MCKTEYAKGGEKLHHPAQDRVKEGVAQMGVLVDWLIFNLVY